MPLRRPPARPNNPVAFAAAPLERHLDRYRAAGFWISDHIADWAPGLRTGFIDLWPEYLEILTVADENAFDHDATPLLRTQRARPGIHALELYSDDTARVRASLTGQGIELPEIREDRLATTSIDAPPDFSFLELPHLLAGTEVTCMTSTFPNAAMRRFVKVAPNGVFALAGLTIVADDPEATQQAWTAVTEPGILELDFTTADDWQQRCPDADDEPGIVCLHLLTEDPDRTLTHMRTAGWKQGPDLDGRTHLLPHDEDHVRFTLDHGDPQAWLRRREDVLGETLALRRP